MKECFADLNGSLFSISHTLLTDVKCIHQGTFCLSPVRENVIQLSITLHI